ncbi:MAG: hypothetical protein UY35_C0018G0002 [Candidatus Saccharibacteria bacterium GW2011_GWC2_48_9]|nr:MAG: hypothetical protein UY35_C0018G0002 [Candidatus Saccharibacteria bacterium GW2011_GWC2_48_9]
MAEVFYNSLTNSSAATSAGATAETKDHISPRAIEVLDEVGIDGRNLRPKQATPAMVEQADRVVYFPSDFMPDYVKDSPKAELWDVVDPHYHREQGMDLVRTVRDDIRHKVAVLVSKT